MNSSNGKWTTYKHSSDQNKKCLLLFLDFCFSISGVYRKGPAYTNLSTGFEKLLKKVYTYVAGFLKCS